MKKFLSIILSIIICFSLVPTVVSVQAEQTTTNEFTPVQETFLERVKKDYNLVFSDEFNGNTLDTSKWQFDGQLVRRNSELQVYADSMEDGNLEFDGESAILTPKVQTRVTAEGRKYKYTSCEISTQNKHAWKYGYFEIRAKASVGKNLVPAIWTMGYDYPSQSCIWPKSGEIDIIEREHDKAVYSSLHYAKYGTNDHKVTGAGGASFSHQLNEEFHNYWLYWTDKYLIVGCDDQMNNIIDITTPDFTQSYRTFEHWLILNVALGMFSNPVNDSEEDQWKMWIDYVRIYQLEEDVFYDDYIALSAYDLKHDGSPYDYGKTVSTYKGDSNLTFTINDEINAGKYDVYAEISNNKGQVDAYINKTKTNEISYVEKGIDIGRQAFVGSVDLQDASPFDISFKNVTASGATLKKLIFIKTDNTKIPPIVVNKTDCSSVLDYAEVSNESELIAASKSLVQNGTIKLMSDIKLTKTINLYYGGTIDLNGFKINATNGRLSVLSNKVFVKNGDIVLENSTATSFITTKENHYSAEIEFSDVNVVIDTASGGSFFSHNYGGIVSTSNNCTFTLTSKATKFIISKTKATYNNCVFNLNNNKAFTITNGSSTAKNYINFNNCEINNALTLFSSDAALSSNLTINLANSKINNLGSITNFESNAAFVVIASSNTLKNENTLVSDITYNLSGNFTMKCEHSFVEAGCTTAKHCEFCNLSEGQPLGHLEVKNSTNSTCLNKGSVKTQCYRCFEILNEELSPVLEHNYVKEKTIEPTCTNTGYHLWKCSECNLEQQRSYYGDGKIIKLAHTPDLSKTTVKAATCTLGGYTQQNCTVCKKDYKQNLKLSTDHNYKSTINEPEGYILYTCEDCAYSYQEPLCNHQALEGKDVITLPTCQTQGFTTHTCSLCSLTYKDSYTNALGHNEVILKGYDATCEEQGLTDGKSCSRENCKMLLEEQKTINPLGHNEVVDKGYEATCNKEGLSEGKHCERCNKTLKAQEPIPITDHLESQWIVDQKATCTTDGKQHKECVYCQVLLKEEVLKATGHNYTTDYVVIKQPTCTVEGEKQIYCLDCGEIKTKTQLPKLSHKTKTVKAKKATYFNAGYTGDRVCKDCGALVSKGKTIKKLVLKTPKIKITASKGKLTFNYTKVTGAQGFIVKYKIGKKTYTKTFKTTKSATKYIKKLKRGSYKIRVCAYKKSKGKKVYSKYTKVKTYKVK